MESELYRARADYQNLLNEQDKRIQQAINAKFPSSGYPFAMRRMLIDMVRLVMDLNTVCWHKTQFDELWQEVSPFIFEIASELTEAYEKVIDKTFKVK